MVSDHNAGLRCNCFADVFWVDIALAVGSDAANVHTAVAFEVIGRSQYSVMLDSCDDHVIPRVKESEQRKVH